MKKTLKKAIIFTIIGLVLGVYFREFTKWNGFVEDGALIGPTSLSFMHTHTLTLGTVMTLLFGTILNQQGLGLLRDRRLSYCPYDVHSRKYSGFKYQSIKCFRRIYIRVGRIIPYHFRSFFYSDSLKTL